MNVTNMNANTDAFKIATMTFAQACLLILEEAPNTGNLTYAKSYARAGFHMTSAREINNQATRILINITHWRGTTATIVRTALKRIERETNNY